jgi:hypothetical protein
MTTNQFVDALLELNRIEIYYPMEKVTVSIAGTYAEGKRRVVFFHGNGEFQVTMVSVGGRMSGRWIYLRGNPVVAGTLKEVFFEMNNDEAVEFILRNCHPEVYIHFMLAFVNNGWKGGAR